MKLVLILNRKDIPTIKNELIKLLHNLNGHRISILTNHKNLESVIGLNIPNTNIYHLRKFRGKYFIPGDILITSSESILKHLKKADYVYNRIVLFSSNGAPQKAEKIKVKAGRVESIEHILNEDFSRRNG